MLTRRELNSFVRDGYVAVRRAVPARVVARCRRTVVAELAARGVDIADRSTWREPVVRIPWPDKPAFAEAARAPALTEVYDQVIGPGAWTQVETIGGTIPVRFPAAHEADDTRWHVDGTFARDGQFVTTIGSPSRGVLCLILLSDIGPEDAPTELKVGSHLDVPPVLAPFGADGCPFQAVADRLPASTFERPSVSVTGRAGDAFVCHPFLIHRATSAHGTGNPRMLAQPGMMRHRSFRLEGGRPRAVERAIRAAMAAAPEPPAIAPTPTATRAATKAAATKTTATRTTAKKTTAKRTTAKRTAAKKSTPKTTGKATAKKATATKSTGRARTSSTARGRSGPSAALRSPTRPK